MICTHDSFSPEKIIGKSPQSWPKKTIIHGNSRIILYIYAEFDVGLTLTNRDRNGQKPVIWKLWHTI